MDIGPAVNSAVSLSWAQLRAGVGSVRPHAQLPAELMNFWDDTDLDDESGYGFSAWPSQVHRIEQDMHSFPYEIVKEALESFTTLRKLKLTNLCPVPRTARILFLGCFLCALMRRENRQITGSVQLPPPQGLERMIKRLKLHFVSREKLQLWTKTVIVLDDFLGGPPPLDTDPRIRFAIIPPLPSMKLGPIPAKSSQRPTPPSFAYHPSAIPPVKQERGTRRIVPQSQWMSELPHEVQFLQERRIPLQTPSTPVSPVSISRRPLPQPNTHYLSPSPQLVSNMGPPAHSQPIIIRSAQGLTHPPRRKHYPFEHPSYHTTPPTGPYHSRMPPRSSIPTSHRGVPRNQRCGVAIQRSHHRARGEAFAWLPNKPSPRNVPLRHAPMRPVAMAPPPVPTPGLLDFPEPPEVLSNYPRTPEQQRISLHGNMPSPAKGLFHKPAEGRPVSRDNDEFVPKPVPTGQGNEETHNIDPLESVPDGDDLRNEDNDERKGARRGSSRPELLNVGTENEKETVIGAKRRTSLRRSLHVEHEENKKKFRNRTSSFRRLSANSGQKKKVRFSHPIDDGGKHSREVFDTDVPLGKSPYEGAMADLEDLEGSSSNDTNSDFISSEDELPVVEMDVDKSYEAKDIGKEEKNDENLRKEEEEASEEKTALADTEVSDPGDDKFMDAHAAEPPLEEEKNDDDEMEKPNQDIAPARRSRWRSARVVKETQMEPVTSPRMGQMQKRGTVHKRPSAAGLRPSPRAGASDKKSTWSTDAKTLDGHILGIVQMVAPHFGTDDESDKKKFEETLRMSLEVSGEDIESSVRHATVLAPARFPTEQEPDLEAAVRAVAEFMAASSKPEAEPEEMAKSKKSRKGKRSDGAPVFSTAIRAANRKSKKVKMSVTKPLGSQNQMLTKEEDTPVQDTKKPRKKSNNVARLSGVQKIKDADAEEKTENYKPPQSARAARALRRQRMKH